MCAEAELNLPISAIPDADDLGAFIARAAEHGLAVTGAGPDAARDGRFAMTVTTSQGAKATEVHRILGELLEAAAVMKG